MKQDSNPSNCDFRVETVPITQRERLLHTLLFEVFLTLVSLGLIHWSFEAEMTSTLGLAMALTVLALFWNYLFNVLFDHWLGPDRLNRTLLVRILHACSFEGTLIVFTIPVVVYFVDTTWWEGMLWSTALSTVALLFAFVFNWGFDLLRVRLVGPYPLKN